MAVYLRIIQGPGRGQVLPIPNGKPVTLGRSASASYAFDDPLLSRKHCAVECRRDMCRIVDLQSRNGTFVNGQRVGAVLLQVSDRIKIGGLLFEVCPVGAPPPPAPPPSMHGGRQTPIMGNAAVTQPYVSRKAGGTCEACQRKVSAQEVRELRGKSLCPDCHDRLDVEEDLIDGFKILERLEVNSFGVTYLAQQRLMDRTVVVKTFALGPDADQTSMRRFMREAKTGGRLSHPNIVELYDVNEQNGMLYIVTEFVDGESLESHVAGRGRPLPGPETLRVMSEIASALHCAHEQSIVHRDVKPANILIRRRDGRAKLQGFTLAKNLEGISVITADGETLGTPFYMPPEQVRSAKNVDARSDIYSWAATTYHCLSGKLPLEARSYGEFIDLVFNQDPVPLEQVVPSTPPALAHLLQRCMARDPANRPASIREVQAELEPVLRSVGG